MTREEAIGKWIYPAITTMWNENKCKEILEALKQEPKTGHWIEKNEWQETVNGFEEWGHFHECSECGYENKYLKIINFCPNCGAKMESEE